MVLDIPEDQPADPARIDASLRADSTITHIAQVHCETGTGILNPLPEIAAVAQARGRRMIVDAMSAFGVIPVDLQTMPIDAVVAASGKCIEGVPGMGFVIVRRESLTAAHGNCHSLAMDLHDQWIYMEKTGQWRFTPPTHVVAALRTAIDQYLAEGGQPARLARYTENCNTLVSSMRHLGFSTYLDDAAQSPIIVTFYAPDDPAYDFSEFYRRVKEMGFILYPGKLTKIDTFRVGCIGAIRADTICRAIGAIEEALQAMGVRNFAPARG